MKKLKIFTGLILIFILGALAGSLGTELFVRQKIENFGKHGPPPVTPILLRRLSHELDLTEIQKTDIQKIMEKMQTELHTLRQEYHPKIQEIFEKYFDTIEEELNAEQLVSLDKLKNDMEQRWKMKSKFGPKHGKHFPKDRFGEKKRKGKGFSIKTGYLNKLTIALDLTEKQQAEIRAINDQNFEQIEKSLTDEQKEKLNTMGRRSGRHGPGDFPPLP